MDEDLLKEVTEIITTQPCAAEIITMALTELADMGKISRIMTFTALYDALFEWDK